MTTHYLSKHCLWLLTLLCSLQLAHAQQTVKGRLTDQNNEPMIGATIIVKEIAGVGTVTDLEGNFVLSVPKDGNTLLFSYVGYIPKEILIGAQTEFEIEMEADYNSLEEVVVVAFGTQKKESVVGAQSSIRAEELKMPVRSLSQTIAGRLAGVVTTSRGGGPGKDGAGLLIRGVSTFSSSPRGPLLVVDGVPDRAIDNIDPEDVKSITVLKDATATAVYGTRGANGVVLIETKKGKSGKPKINFEFNRAVTRFVDLPDYVDAPTFMELYNEGLVTRGREPFYTEEVIGKHRSGEDPDLYPNVDWFGVIFNDYGNSTRATLNVNGGSEKFKYYISTGYYSESGLFKTVEIDEYNANLRLDRFNFTSNADVEISETLNLDFGINGYLTNLNRPPGGVDNIFRLATNATPHIIPTRYSDGRWPQLRGSSIGPYQVMVGEGVTNEYKNTVRTNLKLTNTFIKIPGLKAHTMFAFDVHVNNELIRNRDLPTYYASGRDEQGVLQAEVSEDGSENLGFDLKRFGQRRLYFEGALNYGKTLDKHDFSALLLVNQSELNDATSRVGSYTAAIPYRQRNLVGRVTYAFAERYFAEANFSYSGSDNFISSERYGLFPSFGGGWYVSNESFFNPLSNVISKLKLRYSYGLSGNAAVNDPNLRFLYLTTLGQGSNYSFGIPGGLQTFTGYKENRIGGNVKWETSYRQNLGIEFGLFNDNLQFIVELFQEQRNGILLPNRVIPYVSGLTYDNVPYSNFGETKNKGIDLTVEYNRFFNPNSFITARGTFNTSQNEVIFNGQPPWPYPYQSGIGRPISQRFGYVATGLFQSQEEVENAAIQSGDVRVGDIRYKDLNGDGIINDDDEAAIGYGDIPKIVYGINIGGGHKGFDFSMFFQGVGLVDFIFTDYSNRATATIPFNDGASSGNLYSFVLDRWTPESTNPRPFYPRLSTNIDVTTNYYQSTWWIKDASYLRLKLLEVGYNFTKGKWINRIKSEKVRVYISGTNLLTFTPWKYWDPELGDGKGDRYPNVSVYSAGIRVNLK